MVAATNTNKNAKPKKPPSGVLVSGRFKHHRNAKYGTSDAWNKSAARSLVSEVTDQAETSVVDAVNASATPGSNMCSLDGG